LGDEPRRLAMAARRFEPGASDAVNARGGQVSGDCKVALSFCNLAKNFSRSVRAGNTLLSGFLLLSETASKVTFSHRNSAKLPCHLAGSLCKFAYGPSNLVVFRCQVAEELCKVAVKLCNLTRRQSKVAQCGNHVPSNGFETNFHVADTFPARLATANLRLRSRITRHASSFSPTDVGDYVSFRRRGTLVRAHIIRTAQNLTPIPTRPDHPTARFSRCAAR
jgi:hypothetical protein